MKVRWTRPAINELAAIVRYIRRDSPASAKRVKDIISQRVARLDAMELRFRTGPVAGTREIVINPLPYIAVYEIASNEVRVLHIRHAAQQWPSSIASESE